jgi:hypothetical protein
MLQVNPWRFGVLVLCAFILLISARGEATTTCPPPINYHTNGQIIASPKVYAVYWQFAYDPSNNKPIIEAMLNNLGGSKYLAPLDLYYGYVFGVPYYFNNPTNLLAGTYYDNTNTLPQHACVPNMDGNGCTCSGGPTQCYLGPTAQEMGTEVLAAATAMEIDQSDPNNIILVVGGNGYAFGGDGCSYHASVSNGTNHRPLRH